MQALVVFLLLFLAPPRADAGSVAYLFTLRRERHPLPNVWSTYFKGCPAGSFTVKTHIEPESAAAKMNVSRSHFTDGKLGTSIHVERFGYSIVKVRYLLMHAAVEAGPLPGASAPDWYLFLSDSCAPLVNCRDAHAYLASREGRSFIGTDRHAHSMTSHSCFCRDRTVMSYTERVAILPHLTLLGSFG